MLILNCHISILSYIYVRMISSDKVFLLNCCPDALHHITEIQVKPDLIANSIERAMNYSGPQEQQPFKGRFSI
ncbi:hypothetical protein THOM_1378 [Trachipleistophora hominis]|uniref:Uncharacterized protein n=1 Tax=Trachipleistophora hominis TaxID=72359 RepID=L7JXF0_TRAHO|nr:hypothetical protein THOM_1378 [Trachipleistophora hominis]